MKKIVALMLALVMVLVMTACGDGIKRDSKGYLTESSAKAIAAQRVGYKAEDVAFAETKFEGDSAGGAMVPSRDVYTQAIFTLKGKPLNTYGLSRDTVYKNEELYNIMRALGIESAYSLVDMVGEERAFGDPSGALSDLAQRVARTWSR